MFSYSSAINGAIDGAIDGFFGVCYRRSVSLRCVLKFWLACFLLLFVGAELLEWFSHFGYMQRGFTGGHTAAPGTWLILGGMGLAAASNAAHLFKPNSQAESNSQEIQADSPKITSAESSKEIEENSFAEIKENGAGEGDYFESSIAAQSKEDSISFKIRLPWR